MVKWRVYYGDGSTYSDLDGEAWDAPTQDVQILVRPSNKGSRGFRAMHAKDAYVWKNGEWCGVDVMGLWDYLLNTRGPTKVIFGRWASDDTFDAIYKRATKEGLGADVK